MAKKPSKHEKFYKDSPKLERDAETGDMKVSKKEKKAEAVQTGTEGVQRDEEMPHDDTSARHAMDRLSLHHKHENEHHAHKGGDKHDMHERHVSEHKAMFKKHEKELGATGEKMIAKVESDKKEAE